MKGLHPAALLFCFLLLPGCGEKSERPAEKQNASSRPDPEATLLSLLRAARTQPTVLRRESLGVTTSGGAQARIEAMLRTSNDGTWGFYLAEPGGEVLLAHNLGVVFEPASTIKIVHLLHAMLQIQAGTVRPSSRIPWFQGSTVADDPDTPEDDREYGCPLDLDPATGELGHGLRRMMESSDNRWTLAVWRYFGPENIRATARTVGMERTVIEHRIGCAYATDGSPGQLDRPNATTLGDLLELYDRTATGRLLGPGHLAMLYDLMKNDIFIRIDGILQEENRLIGLPPAVVRELRATMFLAWKAGKYNIHRDKYQSVAGYARLPFMVGGVVVFAEYLYGVFVDHAARFPDQGSRATLYSLKVAGEMLREDIRMSMLSLHSYLYNVVP